MLVVPLVLLPSTYAPDDLTAYGSGSAFSTNGSANAIAVVAGAIAAATASAANNVIAANAACQYHL